MDWREIETRWHEAIEAVRARWPETDPQVLREICGDRARLAQHLSERHDLTLGEAEDAIDDWLVAAAAAPLPGRS